LNRSVRAASLALLVTAAPAGAGDFTLLPEASLHLEAGRYAPVDQDFTWSTWLGGGAGVVRYRKLTAYLLADVETLLGSEHRAFDPNQANYHVEVGGRQQLGRAEAQLFFHHVSRHTEDRRKTQAVAWNVLGVRLAAPLPRALRLPGRIVLGAGHTTQQSLVGYRFELTGQLAADLLRRSWGDVYLDAKLRGVTAEASPALPRGGFTDVTAEAGLRFRRPPGELQLFAAYQHRNDVFVERAGVWDRALFGVRIGLAPATPPGGP